MDYVNAFLLGGFICMIGQILIDKTKLTPGRILVLFVTVGGVLSGLGLYDALVKFGGAGATVPILGFGHVLTKGAIEALHTKGLLGALTGGITAGAGGLTAAIVFGYIMALIFDSKSKG